VLESSNGGSLVNFTVTPNDVFVTYPAERSVVGGMGYIENAANVTLSSVISTGSNAISAGPVTVEAGASITVPSGSRWVIV
jgi:hypothetical protein